MPVVDTLGRPLQSLRLSVTDRCNLRCHYCMPEDSYLWLAREDVLTFEEIGQLADLFGRVGVDRLRLTGGEPLLRRDLPTLVASLAARPWVRDLALTTNGVLLSPEAWHELAGRLRAADTSFVIEPHVRFPGEVGEQWTMFLLDPSGNALEFKAFADDAQVFAH